MSPTLSLVPPHHAQHRLIGCARFWIFATSCLGSSKSWRDLHKTRLLLHVGLFFLGGWIGALSFQVLCHVTSRLSGKNTLFPSFQEIETS